MIVLMNGSETVTEERVCIVAGLRVALADRGRGALLLSRVGAILGEIGDERLAPAGLNARDYQILAVLDVDGPGSQHELAELIGKVPGVVVGAIDELEERGLVARERDPLDRRRSRVVLTRKGGATLAKADRIAEEAVAEVLPGLDQKELKALSATLAKGFRLP
jgi:DNA-binding MarR family transcriptional regulator